MRARQTGWALWAGGALLLASFLLTGHAATAAPVWLMATNVAVHLVCAAFWFAALVSNTGSWMQSAAIPYLVLQLTGRNNDVGVTGFWLYAPMVAMGLIGGSLSDRFSRRRLLVITQVVQAAFAVGLWAVVAPYYGYRTLSFFDVTAGILTLVAAMFSMTALQRHHELTAIEAAGIPKRRIIRSIVAASVVIAAVAAVNRELLLPRFRYQLSHNAQDLTAEAGKELQPRYDYETDLSFHRGETFADRQRIHRPVFRVPARLGLESAWLSAEDAYYHAADASRPAGYLLIGVDQPKEIDELDSIYLAERPVIFTARDTPWLQRNECYVVSNVSFEQLEGGAGWRRFSSTAELIRGLRNPSLDFGADVRVAIHSRFVQPVLDVALLFLGLPLVLQRSDRNVFVAVGLCLAVVVVFMGTVLGCQSLGANLVLAPVLAAWLPAILAVPSAVAVSEPLWE